MAIFSVKDLEKLGLNNYEAVIVAAQHARNLNAARLKALEALAEDPEVDIEARKITMVSLRDVLDGKVKFRLSDSM